MLRVNNEISFCRENHASNIYFFVYCKLRMFFILFLITYKAEFFLARDNTVTFIYKNPSLDMQKI